MNILVTGGAGFIGSHMAKRHLADGHRVVIVDDLSSGRRERLPEKARFVQADIAASSTDLEPLLREEKIDFVSHHAAQIDLRHSVADPIGDARANVIGGLMLFEAMKRAGVNHVLFSSTGGAIYGEPEGGRPAPESHSTDPVSPYGCAKLSIEKYMHYYHVVHGFQTQVFRYANVYGPWQDGTGEAGVVAIFSEAMLGNRPLKINGDGEQTRDYVFVGDLVEAAAAASKSEKSGIWNLGTGVETSVNELFGLLAKEYGYTSTPPHVAAPAGEQMRSVLDGSLVRKDFGLPPWTRLADGLKKTAEFFRSRHQA
jgi:UDP-glucose 4-epimerase